MYLYFDYSGNLKEIVSYPIRQGDVNSKTIYVYVESSANPQMSDGMYKLPANFTVASIAFKLVDTDESLGSLNSMDKVTAGLEIPYDKKRDLKHFKYWTKYQFWKYTLQSAQTSANGVAAATVSLYDGIEDETKFLDIFAFNIQQSVGITPDSTLTTSQYHYLFSRISNIVPYTGATNDVDLGNHKITAQDIEIEGYLYHIHIYNDNLYITTGSGNIVLSPEVKALYGSNEIATYTDNQKNFTAGVITADSLITEYIYNEDSLSLDSESLTINAPTLSIDSDASSIDSNEIDIDADSIQINNAFISMDVSGVSIDIDDDGAFVVNGQEVATQEYVDNGFVPLTNQSNRIYGVNNAGNQTTFGYSSDTSQLIVSRGSGGRFQAEEPSADKDVANKEYVDTAIGSSLYKHDVEIYLTASIGKKLRFTVYDHNLVPYNTMEKLWEFKGLVEGGPYLKSLEQMCFACNTANKEGIAVRFYLHSANEKITFQIYRFDVGTGYLDRLEDVSWDYADLTVVDNVEEL